MDYRWEILDRIARDRVIAVIRSDSAEAAVEAARLVLDGGIRIIEIALTTPQGSEVIRTLLAQACAASHDSPALIGAGTVLDAGMAATAVDAGAQFLVSPHVSRQVAVAGHRHGIPVMLGAATPTEIFAAMEAGADLVKVFPADVLGVGFLSAVRAVFPRAPFVPTGGLAVDDAPRWLQAGAVAVGIGGALTGGTQEEVVARSRRLAASIQALGG